MGDMNEEDLKLVNKSLDTSIEMYACDFCKLIFSSLDEASDHIKTSKPCLKKQKIRKAKTCDICKKVLTKKKFMGRHLRIKHYQDKGNTSLPNRGKKAKKQLKNVLFVTKVFPRALKEQDCLKSMLKRNMQLKEKILSRVCFQKKKTNASFVTKFVTTIRTLRGMLTIHIHMEKKLRKSWKKERVMYVTKH